MCVCVCVCVCICIYIHIYILYIYIYIYTYISNIFAEPTNGTLRGDILKRPFSTTLQL